MTFATVGIDLKEGECWLLILVADFSHAHFKGLLGSAIVKFDIVICRRSSHQLL